YLEQAVEKDPNFASAYAAMADAMAAGGSWQYLSPRDTLPKAKAAAVKALELDDTLAEAHAALAYSLYFADWGWSLAEQEFKRAIELNRNSAQARNRYAECLKTRLRFKEGMEQAQRAQELDPLSPEIVAQVGNGYFWTHRYDEAIVQYQKALDLNPNH